MLMLVLNEIEYARWMEIMILSLFEFQDVFHSIKIFAQADFLELNSAWKNMINFHFPRGKKKKKEEDITIALYQQYYKSKYVN